MMLSDAGYGLLMVIGCGIALVKFKNMEAGLKKSLKMFLYCGISTVFWGAMFGSFFGDAVAVIGKTFSTPTFLCRLCGSPRSTTRCGSCYSRSSSAFSICSPASAPQFYQLVRQGLWKDAVFDVVFWYMLVGGGVVYLLSMQMFTDMVALSFTLPAIAGTIGAAAAGIGAVGIVLHVGAQLQELRKAVLKGLYGLYGVSGYLSDILSYSRLLALGLATGVIASVFNQMGAMAGSPLGAAVFILAFVIGHTLNLGINVLGAYVHTNRLQFVEFFGKFFRGRRPQIHAVCRKDKIF